jgi:hypothetical protein
MTLRRDEMKTKEELIAFLTGHRLGHELSSEDAMRAFIKDVVECGFAPYSDRETTELQELYNNIKETE